MQTGSHLDPWQDTYAERALNLRASEIRALFAVASRPEVVSLAGGMPNIADLPLSELAQGAAELIAREGDQAMQYGNGQGWAPFFETVAQVMAAENIPADPDNVVVTTGSQQAIDLVTSLFINPGDIILAEAPSYVGALGVFNSYQADVHHVPLDHDGLIPEALETRIAELRKTGKPIKFLYTVPNFHNPAGVCMSVDRRQRVAEICQREHILILEDNPYGLLGFDGQIYPAIQTYAPDSVIYLGSFSKIFAPGFRIGWAYAPPAIRAKLVLASESAILSPSMVAQMAIHKYVAEYDWLGQIGAYREMYRGRRDAMLAALAERLPQCEWTIPNGGFYTWVTLPEGIDAKAMLPRAVSGLVAYVSGTAFYADGQGGDHMRLSFCFPTENQIREGVRRLAQVVRKEQELVQLFGTQVAVNTDHTVAVPAPDQP
ncbi:MAG: PLP-dependent aminotransferase family protein [Varibaculum sp.]|nr:PLP-dependent aminotransferase family protein [Varibaculum sp.]